MALILKQENKGASFPRLEPGVYPAICYGVVDIGEQYNKRFGKTARQVVLLWELPTEKVEIDGEDVSRVISKTYNMSLNEKATLRQTLKSWRGRDFTADELQGFDLLNILGAHCLLNITNNETNDGKVYTNIDAVTPISKGMQKPTQTLQSFSFDLDTDPLERLEQMPKWIAERIKASNTYQMRINAAQNVPAEAGEFTEIDNADDGALPF